MMVPNLAAHGNPRIEGVSCAAYQSNGMQKPMGYIGLGQLLLDLNENQLKSHEDSIQCMQTSLNILNRP